MLSSVGSVSRYSAAPGALAGLRQSGPAGSMDMAKEKHKQPHSDPNVAGDPAPEQGDLNDELFETYRRSLRPQAPRSRWWMKRLPTPPASRTEMLELVERFTPHALLLDHVDELIQLLHDTIVFCGFGKDLTQSQLDYPPTQRFLPYLQIEVACLLRALSRDCEARGIDSSPLTKMAMKWSALWREHPEPRKALIAFNGHFDNDVIDSLVSTTARLRPKIRAEHDAYITWMSLFDETEDNRTKSTAKDHASAPRTRAQRRRRRAAAPPGWIYANDASVKYDISSSTVHAYASQLKDTEHVKDPDNGQVRVQEQALRDLLKRKGFPLK
jgi:hypothetical protein